MNADHSRSGPVITTVQDPADRYGPTEWLMLIHLLMEDYQRTGLECYRDEAVRLQNKVKSGDRTGAVA